MPALELHFFHADEPNGSTIFECSTDDEFLTGVHLNIERDSLGGGTVTFARKVPAGGLFTRGIIAPEAFVRVLIPQVDPDRYIHGFWINPRQQQVVSKDESGGEGFTFGGPGPKHYLERSVLWSASFLGSSAPDRDSGVWTWPETAKIGRVYERLLDEDAANDHGGPFLPDLTHSFGQVNDSNGDPWVDDVSDNEDLVLRIGDDYLRILWILEDLSDGLLSEIDLGSVGSPRLRLDLWQNEGRDLTGTDFGPDIVRFEEGVNIATDLDVEGSSYKKASHALVQGLDGQYEIAVRDGWSPGDWRKVAFTAYDSANSATLDRAGRRFLRRQTFGENQIDLRIVPGFSENDGLYFPGPPGTDGYFWVRDEITLDTGQSNKTALDYSNEAQAVTGIELELTEAVRDDDAESVARSYEVRAILNRERKSNNSSVDLAGNRGTVKGPPSVVRLCRMAVEPSGTVQRLYFSNTNPPMSPAASAEWENVSVANVELMTTTPDSTLSASHQSVTSAGGSGTGVDTCLWRALYGPLSSDEAALFAAGGVDIHAHFRARMRYGIGISEAAQDGIGNIGVRITAGATTTIRGTALALHTLASSAGSVKWPAQSTKQNRADPPAAAPTFSTTAVAGTVAGDYVLFELGVRNYTTVTSGAAIALTSDSDTDLPEDESTTNPFNSWIEFSATTSGGSSGDVPHDTVLQGFENPGIAKRVARCDHEHAHGLHSADGTDYHDLAQLANYVVHGSGAPTVNDDTGDGYEAGTIWLDGSDVYILVDPALGAAVWVDLSSGGSSTPTGFVTIAKWAND